MSHKTSARRLVAAVLAVRALAAASPATSLACNGGGPCPTIPSR